MTQKINIADLISPAFDAAFFDIQAHKHTHYWFPGGRGSGKSSFVEGIVAPLLLTQHPECHVVVLRKIGRTIKHSVYPQVQWGLEQLGLLDRFKFTISPPEMTYKPTGQKILFLGLDDPAKVKSIKLPFGYVGIVCFEELDQLYGIKWLQDRAHIFIDKRRCPNTYREFITYEYERNRQGQFISAYPDKENHALDAVRYGMERVMRRAQLSKLRKRDLGL